MYLLFFLTFDLLQIFFINSLNYISMKPLFDGRSFKIVKTYVSLLSSGKFEHISWLILEEQANCMDYQSTSFRRELNQHSIFERTQ